MILLEVKLSLYDLNDIPTLTRKILKSSEKKRKELLLNAIGDDEYQCLLSRLSSKKSHELSFDLIMHLKKFHDNKNTILASF